MLRWIARTAAVCAAGFLSAQICCAQTAKTDDDKSTLHVYVNLVQIPVLVLNGSLHQIPRIPDGSFKVTIEGLGQIHPARIRLEGEDPINLTLLVDRGNVKDDPLWNDLPRSVEPLIQSLRPRDHISFLAMDGCTARRYGPDMAPFDADWIRQTAKTVTDMVPFTGKKQTCPRPLTYWELVTYAAKKLSQFPGRKILVTLGPGAKLDQQLAQQIHGLLTQNSITLFPIIHSSAMTISIPYSVGRQGRGQTQIVPSMVPGVDTDAVQAMTTQAELSGGILLGASTQGFGKSLAQPVDLAGGRYIIEFPRPDKLPPGIHYIQVEDGHPRDLIRIAGISVPIAAPNEMRDATVEHGTLMATKEAAADSGAASHESRQDSDDEKPPAPVTPAALPAPVTAPPSTAQDAATPVPPKSPQPDPADITGDLRPQR